jgi:hypothetical protein
VLHVVQRDLKPDDGCVALRAIANPYTHQAMQVTRTHATTSGHVCCSQTPVLTFNLTKRRGHHTVQARMLETMAQKLLKLRCTVPGYAGTAPLKWIVKPAVSLRRRRRPTIVCVGTR